MTVPSATRPPPARRRFLAATLAGAAALTLARPAAASRLEKGFAPKPELWERWAAHVPGATARVDHAAWDAFLRAHVQVAAMGLNRVDYGAVPAADRQALDAYVAMLAGTPVSSLDLPEQFAYWVNFYNALTVKVVLDHYPVRSIRDIDISPGLFADGPWKRKLVTVEGEGLSLDDMEHRILRPIWRDPRIHYAVNCASVGCPNLQPEAFTAANADRLMEAGAKAYINDPRGVSFGAEGAVASKIYLWFQVDFGDTDAGVLEHMRRYAAPELAARLAGVREFADFAYDWTLNGAMART